MAMYITQNKTLLLVLFIILQTISFVSLAYLSLLKYLVFIYLAITHKKRRRRFFFATERLIYLLGFMGVGVSEFSKSIAGSAVGKAEAILIAS